MDYHELDEAQQANLVKFWDISLKGGLAAGEILFL